MSDTTTQLDAFLSGGNPEDGGSREAASEPSRAVPDAAPDKAAPTIKETAREPAKAAAREPEDDDPGDAEPGQANVPRTAYEKERARRQNWVERASKAEAERDMMAKRVEALEAAKAPPPQPAPQPFAEPIDPARDPEGYTRRMRGVVLNERLNTSEMMALDKHGKEVIDVETEYFQKRAQNNRQLWDELYSKPHPYAWMIENNATARLHEEIGTDPAAYEARLRAKWESDFQAAIDKRDNRVSPAAGLPPSLANARSAAPRGTNGYTGPMSMDDILKRPARR